LGSWPWGAKLERVLRCPASAASLRRARGVVRRGLLGPPSHFLGERARIDAHGGDAWIDLVPGWVTGSGRLFDVLLETKAWAQGNRWMVDHRVAEPRLTARWSEDSGIALDPPIVERMRRELSARYDVNFDSVGFNLYRDGRDSVAWHRDKIRKEISQPIVALVGLGEPRKLVFRPVGGGPSRSFPIGHGDLLVTGGVTQRMWEHAILKVKRANPRMSIAFRHDLDPRAYSST
jgi:alkylated DNA repair dioxygenase AlkB